MVIGPAFPGATKKGKHAKGPHARICNECLDLGWSPQPRNDGLTERFKSGSLGAGREVRPHLVTK